MEYLVLDEAVKAGLAVKETGSVPKLHLENNTGKEVLIIQGEYVLGGGQNRMFGNTFLERGFKGEVPVFCVQRGRWNPGSVPDGYSSPSKRTAPAVFRAATAGQGAVWNSIGETSHSLHALSSTGDYGEIERQKQGDINQYLEGFSYRRDSVGVIVAIKKNGSVSLGVDVFDQAGTMEKNYRKIVESHVLEAIASGRDLGQSDNDLKIDMGLFLKKAEGFELKRSGSVSIGENYQLLGAGVEGSALAYRETPLYVNFSSRSDPQTPIAHTGYRRLHAPQSTLIGAGSRNA